MRTPRVQDDRREGLPRLLCRLWAGLECGVLAGGTILVWFGAHSIVHGEYWWSKFNVAAGWFYGAAVYHAGIGRVTLCGASVVIVLYSLAGAVFAFGWEALIRPRLVLAVPVYLACIHFIAAYFVWPSFGPFARLWFPWTATVPAHFVLFALLLRYPAVYLRLINDFGDNGNVPREPLAASAKPADALSPATPLEALGSPSSQAEPSED